MFPVSLLIQDHLENAKIWECHICHQIHVPNINACCLWHDYSSKKGEAERDERPYDKVCLRGWPEMEWLSLFIISGLGHHTNVGITGAE